MAMSNAGSDHWENFHQVSDARAIRSAFTPPSLFNESVVVTATTTTPNTEANCTYNTSQHRTTLGQGGGSSGAGYIPAVEGRIVKSGRKRPRASRRAPTTLLNTDTANFRAMVQQFTGVSSSSSQLMPPGLTGTTGSSPDEDIRLALRHGTPLAATGDFYYRQQLQQQHQQSRFVRGHGHVFHALNNQQRVSSELLSDESLGSISSEAVLRQIQGGQYNSHGYYIL